ncbi:MAG: hypothetical protein NZ742_04765 [Acidobacteria bacterium]|nr:hypothetical protein [Acidobacteriota bacterium]MDW7984112.1 hypothetical protein [Acidobacteriota bacterium]
MVAPLEVLAVLRITSVLGISVIIFQADVLQTVVESVLIGLSGFRTPALAL